MITGMSLGEVEKYVCRNDKVDPTIWELGVLDTTTLAMIQDMSTTYEMDQLSTQGMKTTLNIRMRNVEIVRFGLKGWSNFKDKNGNDLPFKSKKLQKYSKECVVVDEDILNRIPLSVINELANEISSRNQLTEEEIKNLG